MNSIAFISITAAFTAIIIIMAVVQHKERKDLYDRIMAEDLRDYMSASVPPPRQSNSAAAEVLKRWRDRGSAG